MNSAKLLGPGIPLVTLATSGIAALVLAQRGAWTLASVVVVWAVLGLYVWRKYRVPAGESREAADQVMLVALAAMAIVLAAVMLLPPVGAAGL